MKKSSYFIFIVGTVFFGVISISAMERQRLGALPEQIEAEQAAKEEEMRRRERLAVFEHQVDRAWESSRREHELQQALENRAEGAAFK